MANTPAGPKWTKQERGIAERYFALADKRQMTADGVGRELNCSPTVASQLRSRTYQGRVAAFCQAMIRAIERWDARQMLEMEVPFVRTSVAEKVLSALYMTHVRGGITIILGPAGVGKSRAVEAYVAENPDVIHFLAGPSSSPKPLLSRLASHIGISAAGVQYDLRQELAEKLRGTGRLLVIDECDWLPESSMQHTRLIQDQSGIGLVFVATAAYVNNLRRRRSATIGQFLSRVGLLVHVGQCSNGDFELLAEATGEDLDKAAMRVIVERSFGQARRAIKAIQNARAMSKTLDAKVLQTAFEQLPHLL